jgi:xylan 1,4-beta-xylosidase
MHKLAVMLCLVGAAAFAQSPVSIDVNLQKSEGTLPPVYAWFGYDESNYTTTENGKALLKKLHDTTPEPVYVRAHFLLTSGDGKPELKWSSSNVYSEDGSGKPVYDWTILDSIFDAWVGAHVRPFVELGFMPKALSSHPDPYHIAWPTKPGETEGWSYPPNDYRKWGDLTHAVAAHMLQRYGAREVATWYWEVWNEPDIFYWHGTEKEYEKLYDYAVAGVRSAIPSAKVGGPATTGPAPESKSAAFLEAFLKHCAEDRSSATGGPIPLDFISFHAKGSPHWVDGHVQMGLGHELLNAKTGFAIVHASAKSRDLPIVLSEADPEGCGACSPAQHPEDAYRNGTVYPAYTAAEMQGLTELASQEHVKLAGFLTWAFEFEGQPLFEGQRELATHGIDKPELNFFRMAGLLGQDHIGATSSAAIPADSILQDGVRIRPAIDALATRSTNSAAVMVWNYADDEIAAAPTPTHVTVRGLPPSAQRVLVEEYRIDQNHSNAYAVWKNIGAPQNPTDEQWRQLKAAGQLQLFGSPHWLTVNAGRIELDLEQSLESVLLIRVSWAGR